MADQTTTQLNLCPNKVHYSPRGPGVQVLVKPLSSRTGDEGRDENIGGLYARGIFLDLIKGQFRTSLVHDAKGTPTLIFSLRPLHGEAGVTICSTFFSYFPPKELRASIPAALFPLFSTIFLMFKEIPFHLA